MSLASAFSVTAVALALEAIFGYPAFLLRAVGHPVTWIGWLIHVTETRLNRPGSPARLQKLLGAVSLIFWLTCAGACGGLFSWLCGGSYAGELILAALASSLLAQRSLYEHVRAVADALERDSLEAARGAVSQIVGRITDDLDKAGVARAAIESLAENFSDGVVAPAFWLAAGGLTGAMLYKTINTADSMIGHRTPRFINFGWASARLDDLVNLPAARLSALLLVLAASFDGVASVREAWKAAWRDAPKHVSPNAGWPEAAIAGALGLKLGGPRVYGQDVIDGALMGDGRRAATCKDIRRALTLFRRAAALQILAYAALALVFIGRG
ncbi:cobalamin biosynthesis protein CobD [Methylovirgula ligni]|uniref:Cobalamin biosynthesis protein CobD n=1 Tax=Methylovirgula ligni TaxID=569860 RepID=A0A3D9Z219_9HYPH|nr:adenosylcobinamide-phosphate synthase CbiB [Methylovirgula ligni]QAY95457.1 cobalamin biosynthesis protein CobD [Methylovirgula ligni]REF89214.1 adenosylcobinamide-phosphate synthase [Methylovirgula ligni]